MRAQPLGEQRSLIETALALFRGMERNGDDRVEAALAEPLVVERCHQPACDQMTEMDLPAVFKIEHDVPNYSTTAVSRNGGVEMEKTMSAVSAGKGAGDCAIERLGTFCAKRRHYSTNLRFAFKAKIFALIDWRGADRAGRRIKQRRDSAEKARCCERRHISTSRALSATSSTRLPGAQFRPEDFFQATARRLTGGAQFY